MLGGMANCKARTRVAIRYIGKPLRRTCSRDLKETATRDRVNEKTDRPKFYPSILVITGHVRRNLRNVGEP